MKVLMISGDPGVLNPNSDAGKRMEEYRQTLGTLDILVCRGNIFSFITGFFRGVKIIRKNKPEVITAQDMEHSLFAWIFSRLFKVPWQMQIHTDIFSPYFWQESFKNKIRVVLAKFLLPRASCIRVMSERIKESITWRLGRQVAAELFVTVLPIFLDTEKIKNTPIKTNLHKKYPGRFIILMASRITREKNIVMALEAMRGLTQNDTRTNAEKVLLLIIGDGPEKEHLRRMAYSLKLDESVVFESATSDLASYYKTCDLFLLTSDYEGYGRTLIEAAAIKAKIISSDVGIVPEILELDCIFKIGDKDGLAEKINAALAGQLKPPKPVIFQTKEEYLRLYKNNLEQCQKIF